MDEVVNVNHTDGYKTLKGQCHEIFHLRLFSQNNSTWGPDKPLNIFSNLALNSQRYSRFSTDSPQCNIAVSRDSALYYIATSQNSPLYYIAASQISPLFNIAASQILDFRLKSSAYSRVKSRRYIKQRKVKTRRYINQRQVKTPRHIMQRKFKQLHRLIQRRVTYYSGKSNLNILKSSLGS